MARHLVYRQGGAMTNEVLLITEDASLVAEVSRAAAAAGAELVVANHYAAAQATWNHAAIVLVGVDLLELLVSQGSPRRERVHVLTSRPAPDKLFRLALRLGAENIAELPASTEWLVELLTDIKDGRGKPAVVIGVIGGSGGVGASVFAAALALNFAKQVRSCLIDLDCLGAGLDRVVGIEQSVGIRWDALGDATGRLSATSLREALPQRGDLSVLTWKVSDATPLSPFVVREVVSAAQRGNRVVVIDLPRSLDEVTQTALHLCDCLIFVSGRHLSAISASAKVLNRLADFLGPKWLVTAGKGADTTQVARALGLPWVANIGQQRDLEEAIDLGLGPLRGRRSALAISCRDVVAKLAAFR